MNSYLITSIYTTIATSKPKSLYIRTTLTFVVMEMENENLLREFEEYIKPPELTGGFLEVSDNGKDAEIVKVGFANTKYGRKFRLVLKFNDGAEKSAILSKTTARSFAEEMKKLGYTDLSDWIGKKVKIIVVRMQIRGKFIDKPIPVPAELHS